MAEAKSNGMNYAEHENTYAMFVRLTIGTVVACVMILIALADMAVIGGGAFWVGLIGLIAGLATVSVSLLAGLSWKPSALVLAAMILLTLVTL